MQLQQLALNDNPFTGQLPPAWGEPGAFPELFALESLNTNIDGTLPDAWGSTQAFQKLEILYLYSNNIAGTLPGVWAQKGSFPLSFGAGNPEHTPHRHHTSKLVISRCIPTATSLRSCQHTALWHLAKLLKLRLECPHHGELLI